MKIAMFTQQLSETAFAHGYAALSKGLWDLGIEDQHLLYLKSGPSENISFQKNICLKPLGVKRIALSPFWLASYLRKAQPDVLITMPIFINLAGIVGSIFAGSHRPKLIISERATLSYKVNVESRTEVRFRFLPWLVKYIYPMADGLVVNNQTVLDDLKDYISINNFRNKIRVIPPAVDIENITILSKLEPGINLQKSKNKVIILSIGRLARQKNFQLLIRAFAKIKNIIDARLIIFGEGPERNNLENLISELGLNDVDLPGYFPNPWSVMSRSDVFVLTSEEEAFGRVLVEAMACGIPIVATDAIGSGPRFILNGGDCGSLVPSNDENALVQAIMDILESQDLRYRFIESGKIRSEDFLPKSVAKEWLSLIDDVTH